MLSFITYGDSYCTSYKITKLTTSRKAPRLKISHQIETLVAC